MYRIGFVECESQGWNRETQPFVLAGEVGIVPAFPIGKWGEEVVYREVTMFSGTFLFDTQCVYACMLDRRLSKPVLIEQTSRCLLGRPKVRASERLSKL